MKDKDRRQDQCTSRMTDNNYRHTQPKVVEDLQNMRLRIDDKLQHVPYLLRDMEPVCTEGLQGDPATPWRRLMGPSVACWKCGNIVRAGQKLNLANAHCQVAAMEKLENWQKMPRLTINEHMMPFVQNWLDNISRLESRIGRHRATITEVKEGKTISYALYCTLCQAKAATSMKKQFLMARCKGTSDDLNNQLCLVQAAHDPDDRMLDSVRPQRGGDYTFASMNTGILHNKWPLVLTLEADVLAVQEVATPRAAWPSLARMLRENDTSIVHGHQPKEDVVYRGRQKGARTGTGVAVIARKPWKAQATDQLWNANQVSSQVSSRMVSALVTMDSAHIFVHAIYMHYANPGYINQELLQEVARRVQCRPHSHHIIMGDFQGQLYDTTFLGEAVSAGWHTHGQYLEWLPTNHPPKGQSRRLDEILISPNLVGSIVGADQKQCGGFSTHEILSFSLSFEGRRFEGTKLQAPPSMETLKTLLDNKQDSTWDEHEVRNGSAQAAYDAWIGTFNRWLGQKDGTFGAIKFLKTIDKGDGRAPLKPRSFRRQNLLRKAAAWISELTALAPRYTEQDRLNGHQARLVLKLAQQPWWSWGIDPPSILACDRWGDVLPFLRWCDDHRAEGYETASLEARNALGRWRTQFLGAIRSGQLGPVSRWIKAPAYPVVLRTSDGFVSHPSQVADVLMHAWQEIYSHPHGKVTYDAQEHSALRCQPEIQGVRLPKITGPDLYRTMRTKKKSAAGSDRVSAELLRALPEKAWEPIAAMLNMVEEGETQWPSQLTQVNLIPIPRKDSGEGNPCVPLKARMISVTAFIYRVWASLRAEQMGKLWGPVAIPTEIFGGVKGRSAKMASWVEGSFWDRAASSEEPWYCLYLDMSKCFDCMNLPLLRFLATRIGFDPKVVNALAKWHEKRETRVVVQGWTSSSFRPGRGIPQGCPLSVALAVTWASCWIHSVRAIVRTFPEARTHAICYLDDLTIASNSWQTLMALLATTQAYCDLWQIQLNKEKCTLAVNSKADLQLQRMNNPIQAIKIDLEPILLGADTGPIPIQKQQKQRLQAANDRLDRIKTIPLSNAHMQRLVGTYIIPLLYGIHSIPLDAAHAALEHRLRMCLWGKARYAAGWDLVQCLALNATVCLPTACSYAESLRGLWALAADEGLRQTLLRLWGSGALRREKGPWVNAMRWIHQTQGRPQPKGRVHWRTLGLTLDVHMPKSLYAHVLRQVWRSHCYQRARNRNPRILDAPANRVDWRSTRLDPRDASDEIKTIWTYSANTKDRLSRHFGVCTPQCEHGCESPDTIPHRLLDCRGTAHLRRQVFRERDCDYIRTQPNCTQYCAIWTHTERDLECLPPEQLAWQLWPNEDYLRRMSGSEADPICLTVTYTATKYGKHPQLHRHMIAIDCEDTYETLLSYAIQEAYPKSQWKTDVFILAAILAAVTKRKVHAKIRGHFTAPDSDLVDEIAEKQCANAYLGEVVRAFAHKVSFSLVPEPISAGMLEELFPDYVPAHDQIRSFDARWDLARRLANFHKRAFACYPRATSISARGKMFGFREGSRGNSSLLRSYGLSLRRGYTDMLIERIRGHMLVATRGLSILPPS